MKTSKKLFWLITIIVFLLISGCHKDNPHSEPQESLITGVYKSKEVYVNDDFCLLANVEPWIENDGTITTLTQCRVEENKDDEMISHTRLYLTSFSEYGDLLESIEIPMPSQYYIFAGAVTERAVYLAESMTDSTVIWRYDRITKDLTSTGEGVNFFGYRNYYLQHVSIDKNGFLYCTDNESLIVLDTDLSFLFSITFPHSIHAIARGSDGSIWAAYRDEYGSFAQKVDPDNRALCPSIPFKNDMNSSYFSLLSTFEGEYITEDSENILFYFIDDETIWAVMDNNGQLILTKSVDLIASGIPRFRYVNDLGFEDPSGLYPIAVIGRNCFLCARFSDFWHSVPLFFFKGEDLSSDNSRTIILAHSSQLNTKTVSLIKDWNATHPESKIELVDYSVYNSDDDRFGGESHICFDILNDDFHPDIILTDAPAFKKSERSVMSFVNNHNLYVDLYSYLEQDEYVNFQTLYGLIPRCFDDGNGGIWGISTGFTIQTVSANPNYLNEEILKKGYWTIDEWLDVYESLPSDVEMYHQQVKGWGEWNYIKEGYSIFIDDNTCEFDSSRFIRFLKFMYNVPKDYDTWIRTSIYSDLTQEEHYMKGKLVIRKWEYGGLNFRSYLTLLDIWREEASGASVPIGYATVSNVGTRFMPSDIIVITKYAQEPDICFEAIKSLFTIKYRNPSGVFDPMFSLRTLEEEVAVLTEGITLEELLGNEYYERMNRLFDEGGQPMLEYISEDIWDIITEESSAYFSGHGTAEDCAKKIQSRVSILLAEHN